MKKMLILLAIILSSCATQRFVELYDNGIVSTRGQYRKHMLDGEIRSYYRNGQLWKIATYKNGERDGLQEYYYEDYVAEFDGTYAPHGQLESRCYYALGNQTGREERFHRNGMLASESTYDIGGKTGIAVIITRVASLNLRGLSKMTTARALGHTITKTARSWK